MPFTAKLYDSAEENFHVPRSRTHLAASASPVPDKLYHVVVHNLSPQGLLVESYHEMPIGADIRFDIKDLGTHTARVTWRDGIFYDCAFLTPIPATRIRSKLTNAKVIWGQFAPHPPSPANVGSARYIALSPEQDMSARGLSPRARLAVIVGGAALCWAVPILLALNWLR